MIKNRNVANFIFFSTFTLLIFISKPGKTQELSLFHDLGLYGGQITSLAIDPTDAKVMYAGSWGGDGLFKSTDNGTTWFTIPQDKPSWFRNQEIYDIEIDPNDPETLWVANNHYVDMTRDGGQSWHTFFFASDETRFCYSVAVAPYDSDTVYVGTGGPNNADEFGEIFITDDGGDNWSNQGFNSETLIWNNFWQIKFNPNKDGEVWAANRKSYLSPDGLVLMSNDYAQSWSYWSSALSNDTYYYFGYIDEVLVHPVNPLKIFLGSGEGVAVKNDGSNSATSWYWTEIDTATRALCILPKEPATIYAAQMSTMAKSTDNGVSWDTTALNVPCEFLTMEPHPTDNTTLFAGSLNQGIYTTTDRAQNWSTINKGIMANTIFDTALDPTQAGTILCGTLAGIFLKNTTTGWVQLNKNGSAAVAFHPSNPNIIYAGFDWCIGKSTDKGATWTYLNTPNQEISNKIVSLAIDPTDANSATIYAAVSFDSGKQGQILKIKDNGGAITAASCTPVFELDVPVNAVAFNPQNPSLMIAATGSFYSPVAPGGIYISKDSGQTWRRKFLTRKFTANCIAFDPLNTDIIYVGCGASDGTHQALLKSVNGGLTWRSVISGLPQYFAIRDLKVAGDGLGTVYAGLYKGYSNDTVEDLGGTYISLNGGKYWTRTGLSDYLTYDVTIENPGIQNLSLRAKTAVTSAVATPTYTVYAGTASGLLTEDQSTIAGVGIVSGMITSTLDKSGIANAYVQSTAGTGAQSDQGFYLMLVPSGQHSIKASAAGYLQVSVSSVYVNAGGSTDLNITMTPFGNEPSDCISEQLLQTTADRHQLKPLRAFRDSILKHTAQGKKIISYYYSLGKEVLPVLQGNARLKTHCLNLLSSSAQIARAAVLAKKLTLPPGFMDKASSFLVDLEKASPADLQKKIRQLRCDLRHFNFNRLQSLQLKAETSGTGTWKK